MSKKILLLRFSSIGDIVLTTPVIRCLRQQTQAEVHFLTKKTHASILLSNPYLNRVWAFEKSVCEVIPALRAERFDFIADLHHNLRSLYVKIALGVPARSFPKLNVEKWLLVRTKIDWLPQRHIVHRYLQTVENQGVKYDGKGLDYFIPPAEEVDIPTIAPHLNGQRFISFVIGATHATKRLPQHKIMEFCQKIPLPVVLLGGKAEAAIGAAIAASMPEKVTNCCGLLSLHGSASVLRQSEQVWTHDTGLMHIAAALGKPIVSIWGSTVPKFGMYPFFPDQKDYFHTILEIKDLKCRPCSKIGFDTCPRGHFKCMNEINFPTELTLF